MSATQFLDPKEVYKDFIEDIKSGKLEKLEILYNHVAYIKDLTEDLTKAFRDDEKDKDPYFKILNELANKVLNRIENVLKKLNKEPKRQEKQTPTDIGEAVAKLYEATANMYPGIGDLGKITALIFTLRNTPLRYAKLIYPNIKDDFKTLKEYLGLETYRLGTNGIVLDENMINDERGIPGIIGYPDYPRFIQLRETKTSSSGYYYYFNITTSETETKQLNSCYSRSWYDVFLFQIDADNCGTQTLGGAISCMLIAIKYLWLSAPREELKIEPENAVKYLLEGTTNNPEIKAFKMPYHRLIYKYDSSIIDRCYEIRYSLRSYHPEDRGGSNHSIPLHLIKIGPDVLLGNAEIAFIRFANNTYGYVVFTIW